MVSSAGVRWPCKHTLVGHGELWVAESLPYPYLRLYRVYVARLNGSALTNVPDSLRHRGANTRTKLQRHGTAEEGA